MENNNSKIAPAADEHWLLRYYYLRAAFSVVWVAASFLIAPHSAIAAAALLVIYPVWDAIANYLDAARSGGIGRNKTQAINFWVSLATAAAVVIALQSGMHLVLGVYGAWAILSGLLQLGTALGRRKRYGAQWAMMLSGGQSALAGGFFIHQATLPSLPSIANIAGYAAVGAIYFFISALWMTVSQLRRKKRSNPH